MYQGSQYIQLGDNSTTQRTIPVDVSGLTSGVTAITSGGSHTCARLTSGAVKCWGSNSNGQLSDGSVTHSTTPLVIDFTSYTYTYGISAHKHAVTALSSGESYSHDANGNITTRVEDGLTYTQTFDAENRLISVTVSGQTTQFIYNGDGTLVKKIKPDGSKTIYVGGIYEVDKSSGGAVTGTKTYYPAAGAMRVGSTLYYVLKDHLGSASVVTNSSGTVVGEDRFYAFGETRFTTGTMFTDKLFTDQREMADLGIYHYQARFYSPKLGRFLSADTIVPGYTNPQNLNRYSYVRNNPIKYIDPSGHGVDCGIGMGDCVSDYVPPSGGNGGGGGGGNNNDDDDEDNGGGPVEDIIQQVEVAILTNVFYNPYYGGSSSGCNTWILKNTDGNWCHHTTYTPQPICLVYCTAEEQWIYALSFQYPGQSPGEPVVGGREDRYVMGGDFTSWQWFRDKGHIQVDIDGQTITNSTYKSHIFHQGQIDRTVSGGYVTTVGTGTNTNIVVAALNQYAGPLAFQFNDFMMTSISTGHKLLVATP